MNLSKYIYIYLFLLIILIMFTSCLFKEKIILDSETRPTYHPIDENKVLFNAYNRKIFGKSNIYLLDKPNAYNRKIFGKSNIYLLDKPNNKITKITNGDYFFDPIFSPDGKKIAYIKKISFKKGGDLWIMDADGTNHKQLTDNNFNDMSPTFSKDSKKIIFVRANILREAHMGGKRWYHWDIFEIDLKTLKETQLTYKEHYSLSSPEYYKNEENIIIFSTEDDNDGRNYIFKYDIYNSLIKKIGKEVGYNPTFSNNFNWIAYVGITRKGFDIFLIDIDTNKIKNLTNYQEYMYIL